MQRLQIDTARKDIAELASQEVAVELGQIVLRHGSYTSGLDQESQPWVVGDPLEDEGVVDGAQEDVAEELPLEISRHWRQTRVRLRERISARPSLHILEVE